MVRLRACALVEDAGRVLICREEGDDFWTLPGGSVEAGEFASEGLARELIEELGDHRFRIAEPFLVCENHFTWRGRTYQEVVLAFRTELGDPGLASKRGPFVGAEPHLTFVWADRADLTKMDIRPSVLPAAIERGRNGSIVHETLREAPDRGGLGHPTGSGS